MTIEERMIVEIVALANNAEVKSIEECVAVNSEGELIREAKVTVIKKLQVESITINIGPL